jgi:hypothetical protein
MAPDERGILRVSVEALMHEMDDQQQLFESLRRLTEFTVTEDHLKLLRHVCVGYWDPGEGYFGAAVMSGKKPYGNGYVARDIAEILGAPDEDWEYEDGEKAIVTDAAEERYKRLHVEAMVALQVVLAAGEFRPGRYRRLERWGMDWERDKAARS